MTTTSYQSLLAQTQRQLARAPETEAAGDAGWPALQFSLVDHAELPPGVIPARDWHDCREFFSFEIAESQPNRAHPILLSYSAQPALFLRRWAAARRRVAQVEAVYHFPRHRLTCLARYTQKHSWSGTETLATVWRLQLARPWFRSPVLLSYWLGLFRATLQRTPFPHPRLRRALRRYPVHRLFPGTFTERWEFHERGADWFEDQLQQPHFLRDLGL